MSLTLREIARALGGEVQGRQVLAPAPGHRRIDRSLSVRLSAQSPTGFIVHTFSGHDFREARDHVSAKLGLDLDAWRTRGHSAPRQAPTFTPREPAPEPDDAARISRAVAIWNEAGDAHGSIVEVYLRSRGLELPEGSDVLRYHSACPWGDKTLGQVIRVPAMVSAMRQIDGDIITAVHRTRLTADGEKVDRMMLGKASGAAIKLDADDAVTMGLAIGEGIETCLAARQLGFRPTWALGSAGAIERLQVLSGVEALTLLAENDPTNARAVDACAAMWHAAGREIVVVEPRVGSDLNDAMRSVA